VLDWAKVRELRTGENPARWKGHLDKILPRRAKLTRGHHQAVPYLELPLFMADLRARRGMAARALELTVLTAVRTGEAIGARWSEIDLAAASWTAPAARMKSGREHRVPLSDRVIEILAALPREGDFVFPGARGGRPLASSAMLNLVRAMRGAGATVHGFRSSFKDWCAERTRAFRDRARARGQRQGRGGLSARRHDGEAPALDGRLGGILRERAGRARQGGSPRPRTWANSTASNFMPT
jgi:integrase